MEKKKETKKNKIWERWKAKAIINPKDKTLKEKENIVKEMEKDLPEEQVKIKDKKKSWRPEVINNSTLQKLKLCFSVWMTDSQACYFCWIWERSLYYYQEKHPEFLQEKDVLKESITMQARVNVWRSIKNWNVVDSWKWLEKKDSEFKNVLKVEWELNVSPKAQKLINKLALE